MDVPDCFFNFKNGLVYWFAHLSCDEIRILIFIFLHNLGKKFEFLMTFWQLVDSESLVNFETIESSVYSVIKINVFDEAKLSDQFVVLWVYCSVHTWHASHFLKFN